MFKTCKVLTFNRKCTSRACLRGFSPKKTVCSLIVTFISYFHICCLSVHSVLYSLCLHCLFSESVHCTTQLWKSAHPDDRKVAGTSLRLGTPNSTRQWLHPHSPQEHFATVWISFGSGSVFRVSTKLQC